MSARFPRHQALLTLSRAVASQSVLAAAHVRVDNARLARIPAQVPQLLPPWRAQLATLEGRRPPSEAP